MAVPKGPQTLAQLGLLLDKTTFFVVSQVFCSKDLSVGPLTQFLIHHDSEEQVATVSGSPSTPSSNITVVIGHACIPPIPVAAAVAERRWSSESAADTIRYRRLSHIGDWLRLQSSLQLLEQSLDKLWLSPTGDGIHWQSILPLLVQCLVKLRLSHTGDLMRCKAVCHRSRIGLISCGCITHI